MTESIQHYISFVQRAPSGDNCQPWRFEFNSNDSTLSVYFIPERAAHPFDQKDRASLISLGALLDYIQVGAPLYGLTITELVQNIDDFADGQPCVRIKLSSAQQSNDTETLELYLKREVNRNSFTPFDSTKEISNLCQENSTDNLHIQFVSELNDESVKVFSSTERIVWQWKVAANKLVDWMRMSQKENQKKRDGFYWKNLGMNFADSLNFTLFKNCRPILNLVSPVVIAKIGEQIARKQIKSSRQIIIFAVKDDSKDSFVELGTQANRLWTKLTRLNCGVQPFSSSSLIKYFFENFDGVNPKLNSKYSSTFSALDDYYSKVIPAGYKIIWLWRVGETKPLPNSHRTLRLPINQALKIVN